MLGVTMAEYGQTSRMIKKRAVAMWETTQRLRKKYLRRIARGKPVPYRFCDYWLEYSFGWSATFNDIYSGFKAMCNDPPSGKPVYGIGKAESTHPNFAPQQTRNVFYRVKLTCKAKVTNPNIYLLNTLGLLNPAQIVWEKIKWSFVFDWLFDIGSYLTAWTDEFGLDVTDKCASYSALTTQQLVGIENPVGQCTARSLVAYRTTGFTLPLPNLDIVTNIGDNLKRAANALALTGQVLQTTYRPINWRRRKNEFFS